MTKIGFFFGILVLLLLANTCSAVGFDLTVVPVDGTTVTPGGTISYSVTVTDDEIPSSDFAENVSFWIDRTYQPNDFTNPNWNYEFLPPTVELESASDSKSSTLTLHIPDTALAGNYTHDVYAGAKNQYDPVEEYGRITFTVVRTDVTAVPEFPTVALPVAAILGLIFVFGRKKEI